MTGTSISPGGPKTSDQRSTTTLGFNSHIADAADQVVVDFCSGLHRHDLDRVSGVVGTKDQVISRYFDILDGAGAALGDGVHVGVAFTIGLERIVVAIQQDRSAGKKAREHAHAFAAVDADDHETLPVFAVPFHLRPQFAQEALPELHDVLYFHVHDHRLAGSDGTIE